MEIFLSPGSYADVNALYDFSFPVRSGSVIYGDITVIFKMILSGQMLILILSGRKIQKNMRHLPKMESAFSVIVSKISRHIHTVMIHGF